MRWACLLLVVLLVFCLCDGRRHHRRHILCGRCHLHKRGKPPCKVSVICKGVKDLQKGLEAQTAAVTGQGKLTAGRLDAEEGKLGDIEVIGKKLTDLLGTQQTKIAEQGAALASQEGLLSEQIAKQGEALTAKIGSQDAKMVSILEAGVKLDEQIGASDAKIAALQTMGVTVLDTLTAQENKITGQLDAQVAALQAELPVPDGKFTEIESMQAKIAEKMNQQDTKLAAVAGIAAGLKDKVSATGVQLADTAEALAKLNGQTDTTDAEIDAEAAKEATLATTIADGDAKIADIAAQGAALAESISTADTAVGTLASANLKRKEKLAKNAETLIAVAEQSKAMMGQLKAHDQKLGAVADELAAPPDPLPPKPAAPVAGAAAAAADEAQESLDKMANAINDMDLDPPPAPYECPFVDGDGQGDGETKIGIQTGEDCVAACYEEKKKDDSINGVTIYKNGNGGCWCEKGMKKAAPSGSYRTCFLTKAYQCGFVDGDGSGGGETKIGSQTGDECLKACYEKKKDDPTINGVTIYKNGKGGCWCEKGMTKVASSGTYRTCLITDRYAGTYNVKFTKYRATYKFAGDGTVAATKQSFKGPNHDPVAMVPTEDDKYPTIEGWFRANKVHRNDIYVYMRFQGDKLDYIYHNGSSMKNGQEGSGEVE